MDNTSNINTFSGFEGRYAIPTQSADYVSSKDTTRDEERNYMDTLQTEQTENEDSAVAPQTESKDTVEGERKQRAARKDRSDAKYSEDDFRAFPRSKQHELAEQYWNGKTEDFDDGTFQFSYTHFAKICTDLGFRKGIVDTMPEKQAAEEQESGASGSIIYIDHGKRAGSVTKKMTISEETDKKIEELLGKSLSNVEKSKVLDAILTEAIEDRLIDKRAGRFEVFYRPTDGERLL
jgi:hypothetical protein